MMLPTIKDATDRLRILNLRRRGPYGLRGGGAPFAEIVGFYYLLYSLRN